MLQFDDSCYVDAKQYHLASFSTRNSTLNTSLCKPIRMQDFIQLCDSVRNKSVIQIYTERFVVDYHYKRRHSRQNLVEEIFFSQGQSLENNRDCLERKMISLSSALIGL